MKLESSKLKSLLKNLIPILLIFTLCAIVFYPNLEGKKIIAPDSISSYEKTKHVKDYADRDELSYWNSAQFSGGPIFMLTLGDDNNLLGNIHEIITLDRLVALGQFFAIGLAMYFSLLILNVNKWLSLSITLAYMISLVFFTLVEAGHNKKVYTLIYIPLVISGFIAIYKNRYWKGGIALLLGTSLSIYTGHVQMVYYLIIALFFFSIPLLVSDIKNKEIVRLGKRLGFAIIIATVASLTNFSQLYSSQDFSKQTMRGGGVLPKQETEINQKNDSGLAWDYAMNWSYEVSDFFSIIIPRIVGGASQENVDKENPIAKLMIQNKAKVKDGKVAIPGYWSSMPFTSGGSYVGAGMCFLFILSLFYQEKKFTIAFILSFVIIFLLSLGKNATWINSIFYNYLPLFDKFRAPSSAVSILPSFIAISAGLGLDNFIKTSHTNLLNKKLLASIGIPVGLIVIIWIVGNTSFSFLSANDAQYPYNIQEIFVKGRKELFNQDIVRTLLFMISTFILVYLYNIKKIKSLLMFIVLLSIILCFDSLGISKRYFTADNYVTKNKYLNQFTPRKVDKTISQLEPNGRGFYRVLDLSLNTFNSAKPALFHNQIGGYDAAKLQRYQDIIDYHIVGEIGKLSKGLESVRTQQDLDRLFSNLSVLNMLNCKYVITQANSNPLVNKNANGNAWFVKDIKYVDSDLEEIEYLDKVNNMQTAIVNSHDFGSTISVGDGIGQIKLTEYAPNKLVYETTSDEKQLAIFSEIWYGGETGWDVWINDKKSSLIRTNYLLRGLEIPAGKNKIVMEFRPKAKGAYISIIASIIGILFVLFAGYNLFKQTKHA